MSALVDKLTASGGHESAEFLNDIIEQLWPNINVAGGEMIKNIVEPMLGSMLPGPLASLHFTKIDLGHVPMRVSKVDVHKTDHNGIKLDMDVSWDGNCDIELDAKMMPKIGIEHVKLNGRLSVLLAPLTNVMPLIGAAQIAFINPPSLALDFTDAANIADCSLISKTIRTCIHDIIASMAVLPNRFLVKLDPKNDFFATYQHHLGVLRLTIDRATGIPSPRKSSKIGRFMDKIAKDIPDCYCRASVGAEKRSEAWKTATIKNQYEPVWEETKDFLVADHEQVIEVEMTDADVGSDDAIGTATVSIKQLLLDGGAKELSVVADEGDDTGAKLKIRAEFHNLVKDAAGFSNGGGAAAPGQICGLATVLIAGISGLSGQRDDLRPSIKVSFGPSENRTRIVTYSPGTDIFNPALDTAFNIPITAEMAGNPGAFKLTLMNAEDATGSAEVAFADVAGSPDMVLAKEFDVGTGVLVRACITLRGLEKAH